MSLIFPITYTIWLLSEVLLNRLLRSKTTDKQNADRGSLTIIWVTVVTSIGLATYISMSYYMPIAKHDSTTSIGLAIIYLGILLRLLAILSLGRMFTVDVTIREGHKLKKDGIYSYLRHPSYFASLLSFIGFGISLNNWISLILVVISVLTVFSIRIKVEEKLLIQQFGNEYLEYKAKVKGLIPLIW